MVAQRYRLGRAGDFVALRLVVPEHVGAQRALPAVRARSLVVGDAVGGHQQGGDRIHQGGFARADIAGEQTVPAIQLQRPHAAVEGSPVEYLQAAQAKARQRVVGHEVQAK